MTALTPGTIPQPDTEAWVWANVSAVPGVTSFCYSTIREWPDWLVAVFVQVDARAATKKEAWDRAEQVRQIMAGLPGVAWPSGVVCYTQPVDGPFWMADEDGGPRYAARYELRVHPLRAVPAASMAADRAARTLRKEGT